MTNKETKCPSTGPRVMIVVARQQTQVGRHHLLNDVACYPPVPQVL